jgi:hypothetical protein
MVKKHEDFHQKRVFMAGNVNFMTRKGKFERLYGHSGLLTINGASPHSAGQGLLT